jgi:hypothetical protein
MDYCRGVKPRPMMYVKKRRVPRLTKRVKVYPETTVEWMDRLQLYVDKKTGLTIATVPRGTVVYSVVANIADVDRSYEPFRYTYQSFKVLSRDQASFRPHVARRAVKLVLIDEVGPEVMRLPNGSSLAARTPNFQQDLILLRSFHDMGFDGFCTLRQIIEGMGWGDADHIYIYNGSPDMGPSSKCFEPINNITYEPAEDGIVKMIDTSTGDIWTFQYNK